MSSGGISTSAEALLKKSPWGQFEPSLRLRAHLVATTCSRQPDTPNSLLDLPNMIRTCSDLPLHDGWQTSRENRLRVFSNTFSEKNIDFLSNGK